jgi:hypothetical protein
MRGRIAINGVDVGEAEIDTPLFPRRNTAELPDGGRHQQERDLQFSRQVRWSPMIYRSSPWWRFRDSLRTPVPEATPPPGGSSRQRRARRRWITAALLGTVPPAGRFHRIVHRSVRPCGRSTRRFGL